MRSLGATVTPRSASPCSKPDGVAVCTAQERVRREEAASNRDSRSSPSEPGAGAPKGCEHAPLQPGPGSFWRSCIRDVQAKGGRGLRTGVGDERSPLSPTDAPCGSRPGVEAAGSADRTPTHAPTAVTAPARRSDRLERTAPPPQERPSPDRDARQAGEGTHRVVIVGGGFGGLRAALGLRKDDVDVTVIDRRNFHLFQPLTYQVATGALTPGQIARPLRAIFRRYPNIKVLLADVDGFDLQAHEVHLSSSAGIRVPSTVSYDTLVVAGGSDYSYFGHDEWRAHAIEVKSLESALLVRRRLVSAFEAAEAEPDPERRACWLSFVVVGAGPTGVEMAGQIAELARAHLRRQFRTIDPTMVRIVLVEAGDRVLASFPASLSASATRSLQRLGRDRVDEPHRDARRCGGGDHRGRGRRTEAHRGSHGHLGGQGPGIEARRDAGRAQRCGARRGRPRGRGGRPLSAGTPRGSRAR